MFESKHEDVVIVFYISLLPNARGFTERIGTLKKFRQLGMSATSL